MTATHVPRLVILISGRGYNMQRLVEASRQERLPVDVAAVICNRPDAGGLATAREHDVPTEVLDHRDYVRREAFDAQLAERIDRYSPDWVVLAGFMRVLTDGFVRRYRGRMINLHPSLLPLFPGLHTHRKVIEQGYQEHGSSVHFVTEELDCGPVLAQARIPVYPHDTPESLQQRLTPIEHDLLEASVAYLVSHRVTLLGDGLSVDGHSLARPLLWQANQAGAGQLIAASVVT